MTEKVRKSDLLVGDVRDAKSKLRTCQIKYGEQIGELAMVTKQELVPAVNALTNGKTIDEVRSIANGVFDKIESALYEIQETQVEIDDVIQYMDGWELNNTSHAKIVDVLKTQEEQQVQLRKDLNIIKLEMNDAYEQDKPISALKDIDESLKDYLLNFSRLQDYVQEAVPRFDKLFDEVDRELQISKRYSSTGQI